MLVLLFDVGKQWTNVPNKVGKLATLYMRNYGA